MKVRNHRTSTKHKAVAPQLSSLGNVSLGKLEISTEEILADLRYPSGPSRHRHS